MFESRAIDLKMLKVLMTTGMAINLGRELPLFDIDWTIMFSLSVFRFTDHLYPCCLLYYPTLLHWD
jgi:hypothetical protein